MKRKVTDSQPAVGSRATAVSRRSFIIGTSAATLAAGMSEAASSVNLDLSIPKYQPRSGKKLRLGVVGGGFGLAFPWHLHPDCEVTAVADLFDDRRDKLKKLFRCNNVYGDFHPMLKDSKVDAIVFYTYGPDHAPQCIETMKAGKDAMTVIPAAVTLEDCQQLIDTVKATGRIVMYGETGCFHPAVMAGRQFFSDDRFGQVFYSNGDYIHNAYSGPFDTIRNMLVRNGQRTWRWGFPQGWYSGHATGPIVHLTRDRFAEVSAIGTPYPYDPLKDNPYGNPFANTTFFFRTALGRPSTARVHWMTGSPGHEGIEIHGTHLSLFEEMEVLPARTFAPAFLDSQFHDKKGAQLDLSAYTEALPPSLREVGGHGGSHSHIIHEFVSACLQHRQPAVDVYQAAAIAACGIVGFQSAQRSGELLKIPDFGAMAR